jgi:CubicO group peptidase (beta-lactamase class C family)
MKKIAFLGLLLILSVSLLAQKKKKESAPADRFAGLDTTFARVLKDWKAPGFAVAVVEKNKIVYAKGFGYRDLDKRLPVTPNTSFVIASCTKAFTSAMVGVLQKEGKVELDKPLRTYLSQVKFFNGDLDDQITVRDLMCHRTGLPRHDFSWYLAPTTRDSLMQRIAHLEPSVGIRQRWQYNNWMFLLQGILTEKLTNQSWEKNIQTHLFEPLEMKNSFFSVKDFDKQPEPARGYGLKRDSVVVPLPYYNIDEMGPAGSINSTVLDMAKWVQMWIYKGKYQNKEVVPASYCTEAMTSQMVVAGGLPSTEIPDVHLSNYGLGWFLASYRGHYRVEHGGNLDGFSASTSFFPTDSLGIVVLTNQDGSTVPSIVRNILADRMLGLSPVDWHRDRLKTVEKNKKEAREAESKTSQSRKLATQPSHSLAELVGLYSNDGYGTHEVFLKNDSLFSKTPTQATWLSHWHYNVFRPFDTKSGIDTTEKPAMRMHFRSGLNGEIETLEVTGMETSLPKPITFLKKSKPQPLSEAELKKYEGNFVLAGADIGTYLKDKKLTLVVPNQPEYELVPVGNHTFNFVKYAGFSVVFEMDEKTQIKSLTIRQPNGNFKARKK